MDALRRWEDDDPVRDAWRSGKTILERMNTMRKTKVLSICLMVAAAMSISMTAIYASASQAEEPVAPVETTASSDFDGTINWTDTYVDGKLIKAEGLAGEIFPFPSYSKSLDIMSLNCGHITTSDSDHRLLIENICNTSGSTRYVAGNTYLCDKNVDIMWSYYDGNSGHVLHTPVTVSTDYVRSELGSGVHHAVFSGCVYAGDTTNAPVQNEVYLQIAFP